MNPYAIDNADYQTALTRYATPARQYKNAAQDYNLALNAYKDAVGTYNTQAADYNSSFYRDANNAQAGMIGDEWTRNAPANRAGWGLYQPPNSNQFLLRKPTSTTPAETVPFRILAGYRQGSEPPRPGVTIDNHFVDLWSLPQKGYVIPDITGVTPGQNITLRKAVFNETPTAPAEFTQTRPTQPTAPVAPEGTIKQMQNRSSAAEMLAANERGLIGNVLAGRGAL